MDLQKLKTGVFLLWILCVTQVSADQTGGQGKAPKWSATTQSRVVSVVNETATIVWEATEPLDNASIRIGLVQDFNLPRNMFFKDQGQREFTPFGSGKDFERYDIIYNGTVLRLLISNVNLLDKGFYRAEIIKPESADKNIFLEVNEKKAATTPVPISPTDSSGSEGEASGSSVAVIVVIVVVVVILIIVGVVVIVCCLWRRKSRGGDEVPLKPVKFKPLSAKENEINGRKISYVTKRLLEIPVCEAAAKDTENRLLQSFADKQVENDEFEIFPPISNDSHNVLNFLRVFQQNKEAILTNLQCKTIQDMVASKEFSSCAVEQNSFDSEWRYPTRYALVVFGEDEPTYISGVYVEYNTTITEDMLSALNVPERLNWFRFKVMNKLLKENFIDKISKVDSLSKVPLSQICR